MSEERDRFAARIVSSVTAAMDVYSTYLGDRLGFYRLLAREPMTAAGLADASGCHERYVREWLEHQAATGILRVDEDRPDGASRSYALPRDHAEVLLDAESLAYVGPLARLFVGAAAPLPALLDAYRTGGGVAYSDYGADVREAQAEINRPVFMTLLPGEWIPAMPDVHARLGRPGATVADVGCGGAWSAIGIARAYRGARIDAFDLDPASVDLAQRNVRAAGVEDRVHVQLRDAADPALAGAYDLVAAFETLHDMARPVEALQAMRRLVRPDGAVIVVDERVGEAFRAPADEIERLMYGWSILHCLPAGMADTPSAATGTVMRPQTLRAYASAAGFASVQTLPVDAGFFTVYRLLM